MSSGAKSPSIHVVEAVAEAEHVDPVDISSPLAASVDPDALDNLFQNETVRVSFDYCGYQVTVKAGGTVDVTPLKEV